MENLLQFTINGKNGNNLNNITKNKIKMCT